MYFAVQALEVMLAEGWVKGKLNPKLPKLNIRTPDEGAYIHGSELYVPSVETVDA